MDLIRILYALSTDRELDSLAGVIQRNSAANFQLPEIAFKYIQVKLQRKRIKFAK